VFIRCLRRIEEHRTSPTAPVCRYLQANPHHRVVFHNPEVTGSCNNWRRLQILETQTRVESKNPVDASILFQPEIELHASPMTSRAMTITYPVESGDYLCFAPLRHYRNSFSRFSFFTALFSRLTTRTCSKITAV